MVFAAMAEAEYSRYPSETNETREMKMVVMLHPKLTPHRH
jgi:hypothetical protein